MRRLILHSLLISAACLTAVALAVAALQVTPKRRVTDRYGKVEVKDDYRWLENWNDPAVQAWSDSQSSAARSFLDRLPMRPAVLRQVESLTQQRSPSWSEMRHVGGVYFALPGKSLNQATVIIPEGTAGIEWFTPSEDLLYVEEIVGGPSRMRVFNSEGQARGTVPIPDESTVDEAVETGGGGAALVIEQWSSPPKWQTYSPGQKALGATALVTTAPTSFADMEVRSVSATSKDGTKVPLTILMRKGTKLDGTAPTIIYGYGGYGVSQRPGFSPTLRVWLDHGGIYAEALIRGGGEFGDAWHEGGKLTKKQNVFDDFYACARWLGDNHYTSPAHLACRGGSNGGILMGAMITQHPDLFRAVVSSVGIYDMLRSEAGPNGQFNVTEYGTVKDPAQFAALYAYSPYHHVVQGTRYPAVLFTTGSNDPRVDPMHSRKMTAALQAASASGLPILLRAEKGTGHVGSPLKVRNELTADVFSFLFGELGVKFR
jgi:prolyl oligopeptidase